MKSATCLETFDTPSFPVSFGVTSSARRACGSEAELSDSECFRLISANSLLRKNIHVVVEHSRSNAVPAVLLLCQLKTAQTHLCCFEGIVHDAAKRFGYRSDVLLDPESALNAFDHLPG